MDGDHSSGIKVEEQSQCIGLLDGTATGRRFWFDRLLALSKLNGSVVLVGSAFFRPWMCVAVLNIIGNRLLQLATFGIWRELILTRIPMEQAMHPIPTCMIFLKESNLVRAG
jgi:hypothetical protein